MISIKTITKTNTNYRKVLYTNPDFQLVVMSLKPQEEIGLEKHPNTTQYIKVEQGRALAVVGKKSYHLGVGDAVVVPPNTLHNITNKSKTRPLKLHTIYTPAEHKPGTVERTKK